MNKIGIVSLEGVADMMIERKLENDLIAAFKEMPELADAQVIGSREIA